ncbi:TPA: DUF2800 domain-containing protein [Streptococcus agalactiae]|uniref:DUF2800 domain-containing protein n=1 Tax=Eubacterium callanderi TaxID=53442 RepID=A0AB74EWT0_9FIRM|nr:DUF2800 domain-containing protein [Eubacterium callanderi]MDY7111590.1 hypothetical protein [Eubacterium callanderi]SHL25164.1 Protein of unknown function [Eubacterium callanderi]HEO5418749.1 DUF2800 domain-containing protein [Streptococcus agalactiae]
MPDKHAVLSASSSARWIECPPSALLCKEINDIPSEYARQGTDAHSLSEYKLRKILGENVKNPKDNLDYYDEEMEESSEEYASYVACQYEEAKNLCKDSIILIEQHLDFSKWVPDGFGTGDCIIVSDEKLTVIDLKYGLGILVDANNNPQMMCYALGALAIFDGIYDIKEITMTIFQPRREHISTYTISKEKLLSWAEKTLMPQAKLAAIGEGEFKAGEYCQFCKVKATCRKRAEYNLLLAKYDFEMPENLEDDEIEIILEKVDDLVAWAGDIKEYALKKAVEGKKWNDWKVVEGRATRKYIDESKVAEKVEKAGFDPYEKKVLGITAMTKLLGKARFEEMLSGLIKKPQGKPTLVKRTDKRLELNSAKEDFMEE